ncbi:MAG: hypothetical protein JO252_26020 [Planctomycetaceae bacterium]|nr:hypothetical protein [Planctomycetaceae bacterium]
MIFPEEDFAPCDGAASAGGPGCACGIGSSCDGNDSAGADGADGADGRTGAPDEAGGITAGEPGGIAGTSEPTTAGAAPQHPSETGTGRWNIRALNVLRRLHGPHRLESPD